MKSFFITISLFMLLTVTANEIPRDFHFQSQGNPVIRHKYTADPAGLVHEGRLYIYAGQDACPPPHQRYEMHNWVVFSTDDMKNWIEHPIPLRTSDFEWASGDAWAAEVVERNGKFYWYVTLSHGSIHGKSIGVAVSDSPTGPFKDAKGSAIITNDLTKDTHISWDDIDPTVFIDDDGQAYMYWGNTFCYYVKLHENMIDTVGPIVRVDGLPRFTEAPFIHKHRRWYYLSYASEFPEKIVYARSRSITGPWEYMGILNEIAGNSNTNHQSIVEFKGNWYFIYHNGGADVNGGSYRRSVCIDKLEHNRNGTIKRVVMTTEGVSQLKK